LRWIVAPFRHGSAIVLHQIRSSGARKDTIQVRLSPHS
jgi:hypothetical protein